MGPPRRTAPTCDSYSSQYSLSDASTPPQSPTAHPHHPQPSLQSKQPHIGMSPASRYSHNLKVLRRRDPSIVSIFDQFSHVCLYHHNGNKWEKQGFEGSMFLYERESYPPYGFYILNRMGMYDHIQRLYPEDSIAAQGNYLIIRSYPEYTNRRLSIARSSPSNDVPHKFSDVYAIANVDQLKPEDKGDAHTIGLWMFATDAKEHMIDVIQRLHSYIKQNKPYPEKFRFGPDGPPPPNVHSPATATPRQLDIGFPTSQSSTSNVSTYSHSRPGSRATRPSTSQPHANGNTSELDKLFAKLEPIPGSSSSKSPMTSNMSVETLFAALGGKELGATSPLPTSATNTTSTGLPLLDSIFASASSASRPPTQPPAIQPPTPTEHNMPIYSPTPTTEPQILNQDVISTLLGLHPSRTASAASTAYSSSAVSHPSSREGDNEDESYRRGGSDGYSESSAVLDPDAELDEELQSAGASAGQPIVADEFDFQVTSNGHSHLNGTGQRIHGDVTPRPPMNGFITPRSNNSSRFHSASSLHTEPQTRHSVPGERELVPFETDSDLWPYPRAAALAAEPEQSDGEEIIELDFEDTSVLSDMDTFTRVLKGKKHTKTVGGGLNKTNGKTNGIGSESEKGRGRKKGKKEREADRIRIREEIESSWDVPGPSMRVQRAYEVEGMMPEPASPSPCPSPVPVRTPSPKITPPVAKPAVPAIANHVNGATPKKKEQVAKKKEGLAQKKEEGTNGAGLHSDAVNGSLIAAVSAKMPALKSMERNEFVREVLTLIHTDRAFVDTLWQEYKNRLR